MLDMGGGVLFVIMGEKIMCMMRLKNLRSGN